MTIGDRAIGALLRGAFGLLRALGAVRASNVAGGIARSIGPVLSVSKVADANLRRALPELDRALRRRIVRAVWDSLGRTIGEMPHLDQLRPSAVGPGWELVGDEQALALVRDRVSARAGVICFAGHLANWEVLVALAREAGLDFGVFYRAAGNLSVDRVVRDLRHHAGGGRLKQFPKGAIGARLGLQHLRRGGVLGMLVDQKTNDGIAVPFFGRPAMTAPALAALALRFSVPVIPIKVQRLGPARLRIVVERPLELPRSGDLQADIAAVTLMVNQCLERWIRERPGEWLWLHRRWPKG